ncbi:uncharacterized protein LOC131308168 [Rhododendron vialii]|uniref:uncharacterized protein LOC131308168 n=1 Tax=Rhododendron vialii TaxID=182163 RepID=UPI00265E9A93|nr:uncharacterized protein LOC131308168 [Rhododendron vialii]XP_058190982.1 uncharacterized protein LOC131308168 [Rhododendron vialii]
MEERRDVIPMVLVETLIGLDAVHAGQTRYFGGSPLLLQMWLCDKIGVLRLPSATWSYNPCVFLSRQYQAVYANVAGWLSFLSLLSGEDIFWRCLWLSLPDMAIRNTNTQRMILACLSSFTKYIPSRIFRQFGIRQRIMFVSPEEFEMPRFRAATLEAYARTWGVRMVLSVEPNPSIMI